MTERELHRQMLQDLDRKASAKRAATQPPEIAVEPGSEIGSLPTTYPLARVVGHTDGWTAAEPPRRLRLSHERFPNLDLYSQR